MGDFLNDPKKRYIPRGSMWLSALRYFLPPFGGNFVAKRSTFLVINNKPNTIGPCFPLLWYVDTILPAETAKHLASPILDRYSAH